MTVRQIVRQAREYLRSTSELVINLISVPLVVLTYHRVIELQSDPQMLAVHPDRFRQQLIALKAQFDTRRFDDTWDDIGRPTFVLTFDDGYADNLQFALPILEEVSVPATFFIASGYIGSGREFWWDELERLLLLSSDGPKIRTVGPLKFTKPYCCNTAYGRAMLYRDIHPLVKKLSVADRECVLAELSATMRGAPPPRASHRVMTVAEVQRLAASPMVTIGAHTVSHQPLSSLPVCVQWQEIENSRTALAQWIGKDINVFSYPFGGRVDYGSDTVKLCRRSGFARVASNFQAVTRRWTSPYEVPRFLVRDWSAEELLRRLHFFAGLRAPAVPSAAGRRRTLS